MEKIPQIIKELAEKNGCNTVSKVGEYKGSSVFSMGNVDSDGMIEPTGLPTFYLLKGSEVTEVHGEEALDLIGRF